MVEGGEPYRSMEYFRRGQLGNGRCRVPQEHGVFKERTVRQWKVYFPRSMDYF